MTISSKMKKVLVAVGGTTLVGLCAWAMTKCSSNANDRDTAQEYMAIEAARADSLQAVLNSVQQDRAELRQSIDECNKIIREVRDNTAMGDSVAALNDSISRLVADKDSLQSALTDCASRNAEPRPAKSNVRKKTKKARTGGKKTVTPVQNNSQVTNTNRAPEQTTVNVNGGCGNTVNVNNGTINNYYAPTSQPAPVEIHSSASVTTTRVVTIKRTNCR